MKKKLVSVIVPTRNSERTIENCLYSIKNQTYKDVEIIVVDNNSTDRTKEVAEKYANKVLNKGPERSTQRNYGASESKGDFLFFIDSDMVLSKNVISDSLDKLLEDNSKMIVVPEKSFGEGFWAECKALERSFYIGVDWMEAARFFKREIFNEFGGYDTNNTGTEDYDLPQRIQAKYGIKSKSRIKSFIYHDEGKIELFKLLRKKYYYARDLNNYSSKEENKNNFHSQSSLLKRYSLFFSKPKIAFKNPSLFIAMIFMKSVEFIAGGIGYLYSNVKKNTSN